MRLQYFLHLLFPLYVNFVSLQAIFCHLFFRLIGLIGCVLWAQLPMIVLNEGLPLLRELFPQVIDCSLQKYSRFSALLLLRQTVLQCFPPWWWLPPATCAQTLYPPIHCLVHHQRPLLSQYKSEIMTIKWINSKEIYKKALRYIKKTSLKQTINLPSLFLSFCHPSSH